MQSTSLYSSSGHEREHRHLLMVSNSANDQNSSGSISTSGAAEEEDAPARRTTRRRKQQAAVMPSCDTAQRCLYNCAAYNRICPWASKQAVNAARRAVTQFMDETSLFDEEDSNVKFRQIPSSQLLIGGSKLGEGGFCDVYECTLLSHSHNHEDSSWLSSTKEELQALQSQQQTYALKRLKRKTIMSQHSYEHGAADLVLEAYILQAFSTKPHPHLISLRGIAKGDIYDNLQSGNGFYLVIDKLVDTLEERIYRWAKQEQEEAAQNSKGSFRRSKRRLQEEQERRLNQLCERLTLAIQIASAMEHLHSQLNLVYRDLKPDNIGFDTEGQLKLFDFGLAKELKLGQLSPTTFEGKDGEDCLPESIQDPALLFDFTSNTGSRRYMAPEVAKDNEPYNQSVDVYSFAILLWELLTATKPFAGYHAQQHQEQVVMGGERPPMPNPEQQQQKEPDSLSRSSSSSQNSNSLVNMIQETWPVALQLLIHKCWATNPQVRPNFTEIQKQLRDVLQELQKQQPSPLASRTPSFRHQNGAPPPMAAIREKAATTVCCCCSGLPSLLQGRIRWRERASRTTTAPSSSLGGRASSFQQSLTRFSRVTRTKTGQVLFACRGACFRRNPHEEGDDAPRPGSSCLPTVAASCLPRRERRAGGEEGQAAEKGILKRFKLPSFHRSAGSRGGAAASTGAKASTNASAGNPWRRILLRPRSQQEPAAGVDDVAAPRRRRGLGGRRGRQNETGADDPITAVVLNRRTSQTSVSSTSMTAASANTASTVAAGAGSARRMRRWRFGG